MEIVNILEGDGETVNVVQGHPYEPMIACSGIDSTVKIFGIGGDSRERETPSRVPTLQILAELCIVHYASVAEEPLDV